MDIFEFLKKRLLAVDVEVVEASLPQMVLEILIVRLGACSLLGSREHPLSALEDGSERMLRPTPKKVDDAPCCCSLYPLHYC